ncbi:Type IV fimbrial biogenesis protein PilW, partial [hydrothermal vent metagenome]
MNKKYTISKISKGFSIVELMIAIVIGLIVLTGLITVFETTSSMNKTQNGLARIQENGRFAILHMKQNIEQAGYQYCLSSGSEGMETTTGTIQRPWKVYTTAPLFPGTPVDPANFYFDTKNLIHGHECDAAACLPGFGTPGSDTSYPIPAIGVGDGDRLA